MIEATLLQFMTTMRLHRNFGTMIQNTDMLRG
jgi:hypothetical protein